MASREKSLAKNTLILTIGKVSTQAISFFLLPLYTAYLSREDYGVVDLLSTIITLLLPIVSLQMEQAIFRYMTANRNNESEIRKVISVSFTFIFLQIAVYVCVFMIVQLFVNNAYKWFLLSNLISAVFNFSLMQVLRGFGDNVGYALAAFISSVVNIAVNLILILCCNWGATAMLTAALMGNIISSIFIICRIKIWRFYQISLFEKYRLKELLSYCVPLVPNELSWWAIRASDRFVIAAVLGTAINGIVAVAHKFPSIFIMFYNIFGIAWNESVILHLRDDDGDVYFSSLVNKMIRLFSCIALLIIATMPIAFGLLVNDSFHQAYDLIPLYMIGAILNVIIGLVSVVYIVYKRTKVIAKTSFVSAIICILSNIILVKIIGVYASPVSNIIGFGAMALYRCIDCRKYVKVKWDIRYVIAFIIMLSFTLLCYYLKFPYMRCLGLVMATLFVFWSNKTEIYTIINMCISKCQSILNVR